MTAKLRQPESQWPKYRSSEYAECGPRSHPADDRCRPARAASDPAREVVGRVDSVRTSPCDDLPSGPSSKGPDEIRDKRFAQLPASRGRRSNGSAQRHPAVAHDRDLRRDRPGDFPHSIPAPNGPSGSSSRVELQSPARNVSVDAHLLQKAWRRRRVRLRAHRQASANSTTARPAILSACWPIGLFAFFMINPARCSAS